MRLQVDKDEFRGVDRDGQRNEWGRQGFEVFFPGLTICFEDEADAARMAQAILLRLGETASAVSPPPS